MCGLSLVRVIKPSEHGPPISLKSLLPPWGRFRAPPGCITIRFSGLGGVKVESIVALIVWPAAIAIIALGTVCILRPSISALIGRTRKIEAKGQSIDFETTTDKQQLQIQEQKQLPRPIAETPMPAASPEIAKLEGEISQALINFNDPDKDTTIRRLVRAYALTLTQKDFEVVYRIIFGSQLELLLLANAGGVDLSAAEQIFERAKAQFPVVHANAAVEDWLSYPIAMKLLEKNSSRLFITGRGQEFLHYLVQSGLTGPKGN